MAATETEICNLALGHLGEAPIASLAEDTAAGRACALYYEQTRDAVLRSHRWNFAAARVAIDAEDEAPAFGWAKAYALPEDCLRVLEVNGSEAGDWISDEFAVEGRMILTDATTLNLVYVAKVEDVTLFDPLFVEALAIKLAIALSETIRGTTGKAADLATMYEQKTAPLARRVDANEGRRRKGILPMNSLAIRARFQGGFTTDNANFGG